MARHATALRARDVLGVAPDASRDDIRRAYKKLAMEHHPDKGGDPGAFIRVTAAYEALSHVSFDGDGPAPEPPGPAPGAQFVRDLFARFMMPHKMPDAVRVVTLSLREAFAGGVSRLEVDVEEACAACRTYCGACAGYGRAGGVEGGPVSHLFRAACQSCRGSGWTRLPACSGRCGGTGRVVETREVTCTLPPGFHDGHRVRFEGLGARGGAEGVAPGDLVVEFRVSEDGEPFGRDGDDLTFRSEVAWVDSVVGTRVTVPAYDGEFTVDTAGWGVLGSREWYTVPGRGMPIASSGGRGDLRIAFDVVAFPREALAPEVVDLLRAALAVGGVIVEE
jgi:DnaJ-class molecular chaperone